MNEVETDPEAEVVPNMPDAGSMVQQSTAGIRSSVPDRNEDSIRRHAEDFVVQWMLGAVQKSKKAIVDQAMKQSTDIFDIAQLDLKIIDVISKWNFSQELESAKSIGA
jgi:hypothetical protein